MKINNNVLATPSPTALTIALLVVGLLSSSNNYVQAFPSGAGGCAGGQPAVSGPHISAESSGTLSIGNLVLTVDGIPIDEDELALESSSPIQLIVGQEHELELTSNAGSFRGVLFRAEAADGSDSILMDTTDEVLYQPAGVCVTPIVGITHTSREDKTSAVITVQSDVPGLATLDITVVESLAPSIYYYSGLPVEFIVAEAEVEATASPTGTPTSSPTSEPTASPTASPTTAATEQTTDAPVAVIVTAVPTASPTASPTAATTDPIDDGQQIEIVAPIVDGGDDAGDEEEAAAALWCNGEGDTTTILDLICGDDNLSIMCDALWKTGLHEKLNSGRALYTVFAPTNEAFEHLPNLPALMDSLDWLHKIISYHVLEEPKVLHSYELPCVAGHNLLDMSNHEEVRSICKDGIPTWMKGASNQCGDEWLWDTRRECVDAPKFVWVDVEACNGAIHILDGVMLF